MRIRRFLCTLMCMTLAVTSLFPATAAGQEEIKGEIPITAHDPKTSAYRYSKMDIYSQEEAVEAGVPFGYSGYVMGLTGDSAVGITVDFSDRNIPLSVVKALHMRVYYTDKQREVRITIDAGVSWVMRHEAKKPGEWEDVVLSNPSELKKLANDDGMLGVFGFGFRNYDGTRGSTAYIDEISAELIDGDDIPPRIEYDGPDHIETTEGKPFAADVSAYDDQEKAAFPVEYVWDKQATDGEGNLIKGEYKLTLRASDSFGNKAEKTLTVTVGERDTTPPVILFDTDKIETLAGAHVMLDIKAEDDHDPVSVVMTWSDGAVDRAGRLTKGTHTLTLTAADLTGNKAEKTVTVVANDRL